MAEENDIQSVDDTLIESAVASESDPTQNRQDEPDSNSSRPLSWFAVFLALVAAGLGGYAIYTSYLLAKTFYSVDEKIAAVDDRVTAGNREISNLKSTTKQQNNKIRARTAAVDRRIGEVIASVRDNAPPRTRDWTLAEVEYLLRLANQRIIIEKALPSALSLMKSADQLLRDTDGIAAFELRRVITGDIARIESTPQVDISGIYLQLEAIAELIDELPQKSPIVQPHPTADVIAEAEPDSSGWGMAKGFYNDLASRLGQLVVISRQSEPIKPALMPSEVYFLRENLRLRFRQAQLATLSGNQLVFDSSLRDALGWLSDHFDAGDPLTVSMQKQVSKIANNKVSLDMPDITGSLEKVREMVRKIGTSAEVESSSTAKPGNSK